MTFDTLAQGLNRQPFTIVEIDINYCGNVYGDGASGGNCLADLTAGNECYQGFFTCQDPDNFQDSVFTLRLCSENAPLPHGLNAIPCVKSVNVAPTKLSPGKGLGQIAKATVIFSDFVSNDVGFDPYVSNRNYIATDQGTFWGRMLSRFPYTAGRTVRIKTGYLNGSAIDEVNDFQTYQYVVDSISPPSKNGSVILQAKDPLSLVNNLKRNAPAASTGKLAADIAESAAAASTFDVGTGFGASYGSIKALKFVRINGEILQVTLAGDTFTIVARGQWGSEVSGHSTGDTVQECLYFEGTERIDEVVRQLLVDHGQIDASFINLTEWSTEADRWLDEFTPSNIISEPTKITEMLNDITEQVGVGIWWSDRDHLIKLKTEAPVLGTETATTYTDDDILLDSETIKLREDLRISRCLVYHTVRDYTEDNKARNFKVLELIVDTDSELDATYMIVQEKTIFARWINGEAQSSLLASRYIARFKRPPIQAGFKLDVKDHPIRVGAHVFLDSGIIQDVDGSNLLIEMQCLAVDFDDRSQSFTVEALQFSYSGSRLAVYAPETLNDYTTESQANQDTYAFYCDDTTELMSNGDEPYLYP